MEPMDVEREMRELTKTVCDQRWYMACLALQILGMSAATVFDWGSVPWAAGHLVVVAACGAYLGRLAFSIARDVKELW